MVPVHIRNEARRVPNPDGGEVRDLFAEDERNVDGTSLTSWRGVIAQHGRIRPAIDMDSKICL